MNVLRTDVLGGKMEGNLIFGGGDGGVMRMMRIARRVMRSLGRGRMLGGGWMIFGGTMGEHSAGLEFCESVLSGFWHGVFVVRLTPLLCSYSQSCDSTVTGFIDDFHESESHRFRDLTFMIPLSCVSGYWDIKFI